MMKKIIKIAAFLTLPLASVAQDAGIGLVMGVSRNEWYGADVSTLNDRSTGITMGKDLPNLEGGATVLVDEKGEIDEITGLPVVYSNHILLTGSLQKRTGFFAGFEVNSELSSHFWLKHEFLFATKGFTATGTRYDTTLTALEAGINMRFRSFHVDVIPFALDFQYGGLQSYFGPYVSVLLRAQWLELDAAGNKTVSESGVYDFHYYDVVTDKLESRELGILDYGFVLGVEYEFDFHMSIGAFYKMGIGRTMEARSRHTKTSAYNRSINVSIGYTFGED